MASILEMIANPTVAQPGAQFRAGQQEGLQDSLLREQLAEQQQTNVAQQAQQTALTGVGQSIGTSSFQGKLQQLASINPTLAQNIQTTFQGIQEADLKNAFSNIAIASGLPGINQNQFLETANQSLSARPDLQAIVKGLQDTPPEQRAEVFQAINQIGEQLGIIEPREQQRAPAKTTEQLQKEIDIKEKQAATSAQVAETGVKAQKTRESELLERQAETKRKAGELKPTMQGILDKAQTQAFDAEKTANGFDLLVKDFDRLGFKGGTKASISDFLKDVLGTQDEVSQLRRKFRGIRASQATKNLPPGPASDKDIALALSGFPPESAPANVISSFLTGAAKIARIDQAFQTFKAEYISDNKNTSGLIKSWKKEKGKIIDDAIKNFEQGVTPGSTIVVRSDNFGDVTEDDITRTMEENNLTRDQVLERL